MSWADMGREEEEQQQQQKGRRLFGLSMGSDVSVAVKRMLPLGESEGSEEARCSAGIRLKTILLLLHHQQQLRCTDGFCTARSRALTSRAS